VSGVEGRGGGVPLRASRPVLVGWTFLVALVGVLVAGFFLLLVASDGLSCLMGGALQGWGAHGAVLAASWVIGASLWLVFSVLAWLRRRRLGVLLAWFAGSYLVGLILLGVVARIVWGPDKCG
jgi:hypothetical protein